MTRFLKRAYRASVPCQGCALHIGRGNFLCDKLQDHQTRLACGNGWFNLILVPRPPDGTRCRDLKGNIKVVGRDV